MKKTLIASLAAAMVVGITGTSFAATVNPFSDVPAKHWAYGAVNKLSNDGILEGYGDSTFRGDKAISRYEMAIIIAKAMSKVDKADAADKALIERLGTEFSAELAKLDVKYNNLEKRVDNVMLSGYIRSKYDSDVVNGANSNGGNKHFYMDFEGKLKVNDNWDGHFQSETNKHYTNTTWGNSATGWDDSSSGGDGTIQRIWAEGKIGNVGVIAGQKWWGYASNVIFGHAAAGVQLDFPIDSNVTASVFSLKPSQGGLTSSALSNPTNTSLHGISFNADLSKSVHLNLVAGGNHKTGNGTDGTLDTGVSNWSAIDVSAKFGADYKLTGTYTRTNANTLNNSQEVRLDYKACDINTPGSYDIYARYVKFQKYGDISHDDEWGSLPGDMKGWVVGVDYALAKNVQWTTLYSSQTTNLSSTKDARKLIRTEVDLHF